MEDQANGRVLRIGQEKRTYFIRLLLRGSRDESIRDLQNEKTVECAPFMDDERAMLKQGQRLSLRQASGLFGVIREVDGKLVVVNEAMQDGDEDEEMDDDDETDGDDELEAGEDDDMDETEEEDELSNPGESDMSEED